ncbi:epoxide hydrolase family protein [Falsirhodobacter sp. 1013]|uniref:epoxide hydrolase family protein n=1 Tax=Falsirhodobacter sp. 1013 TaxID=3417566 RepID=UPI003EBEBEBE
MISPYTINISEERLSTIRDKVEAYDWSQLPDAGGWSAGVGVGDLKRLAAYWRDSYDWRAVERRLNALLNFTADVEGERLHFVHVKGDASKPPVLLLHGWPGSYLEFERLLEPLAADGHDVVVPSLPGFAFSNPNTRPIGPRRAAALVHGLMIQLFGDTRYFVQGGDWGHALAAWAAHDRPDALLGIHINMMTVRAEDAAPTTREEKSFADKRAAIADQESAYFREQETYPQTLGVAMADSPVGAAGWILEKFGKWADLPRTANGDPDIWSKFSEEELLTNIMLYIAPASFVTATWIYYGSRLEKSRMLPAGTRIQVPTGVAAFPDPMFPPPPRSFAEKTYNIVQWTDMPRGGHFAALEEPELMLADLRAFIAEVSGARA